MFSTLRSGISLSIAGRFLGRFLAVVAGVIIARTLPPHVFGLYAIAIAFVRLSEVIIPLGFDIGVIKYGTAYINDQSKFKGVITFSLIVSFGVGLFISLLIFIFSDYIALEIFQNSSLKEVFPYITVIVPFLAFLSVSASATRISQNPKYSIISQDFGQPFLSLVFFLLFAFSGWRLQGALLAEALSIIFSTIFALVFLWVLYPFVFNKSLRLSMPPKEYYQFSFLSSFSIIFITAILWVDRLILGVYQEPKAVGIYQAATQLSVVFAVILSGINRIVTPIFADLYAKEQIINLQKVYQVSNKWGMYLGIPILIGFSVRAVEIIGSLYGKIYLASTPILYILLAGQIINLCTGSVAVLLNIAGYQLHLMVVSGLSLALSVFLNFLLIPIYGELGAAVSTSFSLALYYLYLFVFAGVKLRMWPIDISFLKIIPASLICVGSFFIFGLINNTVYPLLWLLVELTVSSLLFWISIYVFERHITVVSK